MKAIVTLLVVAGLLAACGTFTQRQPDTGPSKVETKYGP
jgi:hypothetical protein